MPDICLMEEISIGTLSQFDALLTFVVDSLVPSLQKNYDPKSRCYCNFESVWPENENQTEIDPGNRKDTKGGVTPQESAARLTVLLPLAQQKLTTSASTSLNPHEPKLSCLFEESFQLVLDAVTQRYCILYIVITNTQLNREAEVDVSLDSRPTILKEQSATELKPYITAQRLLESIRLRPRNDSSWKNDFC